jgi:hypothetical protein
MHLANASAADAASAGAVGTELVALPAAAVFDAGAGVLPTVVAVGLPELPPHPATRSPPTSVATATSRA